MRAILRVRAWLMIADRVRASAPSRLLEKEAALFVPSGTMSNQIALLCHTNRSDEVYVGEGWHCAYYESGAGAAWAGVQFAEVGKGGTYTAAELRAAIRPIAYYMPTP